MAKRPRSMESMVEKTEFWAGHRVLVTGATGFIGSHLTRVLLDQGAWVRILVKPQDPLAKPSIHPFLKKEVDVVEADIRQGDRLSSAVTGIDTLFHLAAYSQVIHSIEHPQEAVAVNTLGTLHLLEAVRRNNLNAFFVLASTDKVYGEPQTLPIDEHHPLNAKSPYDASKLAADRLVYAYGCTYGLQTAVIRWANTIGGQDFNLLRIVPDFISALMRGKAPVIRGHGRHIRDYLYVEDAVAGILRVAEKRDQTAGEVFNLGTEKPTAVVDIVKLLVQAFGSPFEPIVQNRSTPGEIDRQYLSSRKAQTLLNWHPQVSLPEALARTVAWYRENPWWMEVAQSYTDSFQSS